VNRHEHSGLVVPPGDDRALASALNRLLNDAVLRQRMGDSARQRVADEFTAGRMTALTSSLYRDVFVGAPVANIAPVPSAIT
jgi:glycosyltransferase involved in cell wall biosynthesis